MTAHLAPASAVNPRLCSDPSPPDLHRIHLPDSLAVRELPEIVRVNRLGVHVPDRTGDRLEGGAENLSRAGLETVSIYTRHDFIDEAPLSRTLSDSTLSESSDS